jgi:hypothetical protein
MSTDPVEFSRALYEAIRRHFPVGEVIRPEHIHESVLDVTAAYRAAVLAEAKVETVAWLVKKAREYRSTGSQQHARSAEAIEFLASKVDRGAVRVFVGTAHYRAAVLREAAAYVDSDDMCGCGGCDSCVLRRYAAGLRDMATEAEGGAPVLDRALAARDDLT